MFREHLGVRDPSRLLGLRPRAAFGLHPLRGSLRTQAGVSLEWHGDMARLAEKCSEKIKACRPTRHARGARAHPRTAGVGDMQRSLRLACPAV